MTGFYHDLHFIITTVWHFTGSGCSLLNDETVPARDIAVVSIDLVMFLIQFFQNMNQSEVGWRILVVSRNDFSYYQQGRRHGTM